MFDAWPFASFDDVLPERLPGGCEHWALALHGIAPDAVSGAVPGRPVDALKKGWMHTGDLGYRNGDGFYFVTDRKKDMIISGGENIYPREVEDVLFEHPDILEAAVVGVSDEKWGERVHAVIVAQPGQEPDLDEVIAFTRERLAGYKVPKSAELLPELPKNATGKVLKTELRKTVS